MATESVTVRNPSDKIKVIYDSDNENEINEFIQSYGDYTDYEKKMISLRISELIEVYKPVKEDGLRLSNNEVGVELNLSKLMEVVCLYVNDIKQARTFHETDGPSPITRAAYMARFISKIRPIDTIGFPESKTGELPEIKAKTAKYLLNINEIFACKIFGYYIGITSKGYAKNGLVPEVYKDLIYVFKRQDPQKELLVTIGKALNHYENMSSLSGGAEA